MERENLNIIVEANIPFVRGLLEPYANVQYLAPDDINREAVKDTDALLVRTRTRCDEALLSGSRCRFVGTATIGFDHIDRKWCADHGIHAVNAPGCNAPAVAQYVFASIATLMNRPVDQYSIGIVGVGNVGKIVEMWARSLGMRIMLCDPPRQRTEGGSAWCTLQEIAEKADIITFHTPLTRSGNDCTYHMADAAFFASLRRSPILINAARGGVVDNAALVHAIDAAQVSHAVIDTWEGEPNIMPELLQRTAIATPHIAGYSYEGKVRATTMVLNALTAHFNLPSVHPNVPTPPATPSSVRIRRVLQSYNPLLDDAALRANPHTFEALRNHYNLRHEVE
jgi:erythronate-4-phosphate dehydrogenase